jgi:transposase
MCVTSQEGASIHGTSYHHRVGFGKAGFQVHGATADGRVAFRKKLSRGQVLAFFSGLPPCMVAMEACATAHYWAREIGALGHEIRLVPPAHVKPFVKRQKNDGEEDRGASGAA